MLFAAENGNHAEGTKKKIYEEVLKQMESYEENAYDEGWEFHCAAMEAKRLLGMDTGSFFFKG
ncbi:hypothetical protein AGMMS49992_31370 [Clostridia bacterium]|nr:hypothetical protein AGMMS49992_31370 [Clostridia bacterium]